MLSNETQYLNLLSKVMVEAEPRQGRTAEGYVSSFFTDKCVYDINPQFPLLTTKKVNFKAIVAELLWFISGSTNIKDLDSKIWDEWADENGDVGPVYGASFRNLPKLVPWGDDYDIAGKVDQLLELQTNLRKDPMSRRHLLVNYNPCLAWACNLPPCHALAQFYVDNDYYLHCHLYQRSADLFLGVPFNIASYSLLTMMLANTCDLGYGTFSHTLGDAHIYENHFAAARTQLARNPTEGPIVEIANRSCITEYVAEDFSLINYNPHPAIKAPIAV